MATNSVVFLLNALDFICITYSVGTNRSSHPTLSHMSTILIMGFTTKAIRQGHEPHRHGP